MAKAAKKSRKPAKREKPQATKAKGRVGDAAVVKIAAKDVRYLASFADERLNKAGNISSSLGQEISTYVGKGLNGPAFRIALRLYRLGNKDPIKLRAMLDDVDYYRECLGLDKLKAPDLFKDKPSARRTQAAANGAPEEPAEAEPSLIDAIVDAMPLSTDETAETTTH